MPVGACFDTVSEPPLPPGSLMTTKFSGQRADTADAATAPTFTYNAFLSYRSTTDYNRARKIETFLEAFHKNAGSKSVAIPQLQICRDGSDFTLPQTHRSGNGSKPDEAEAGVDPIWPIIQAELSRSKFLVVLCSPGSVSSPYMVKEINWFMANRGAEWIIPVVTEGADPKTKPEECFPAELISSRLHESLIWYDLRGLDRSQRAADIKDHEDELVRLAADLLNWDSASHGPLAAIWQREQWKRRRRQSFMALAAAALVLVFGGYALVSAQQREQALLELESTLRKNEQLQTDRQQAIDQRDREVAERERVANDRDRFFKERNKALAGERQQAEKAFRAAKIAEQRHSEAVEATKNEAIAKEERRITAKESIENERVALLESGRDALANRNPFQAAVYLSRAYKISPPDEGPDKTSSLRFLLGLAMRSVDQLRYSVSYEEDINSIRFSPDGTHLAIAGADNKSGTFNTARVLEAGTGEEKIKIKPVVHKYDVNTAEFSFDGEWLVTSSDDNYVKVRELKTKKEISLEHKTDVKSAKFSPDARRIAAVDVYDKAMIWDLETRKVIALVDTEAILASRKKESSVKSAEFSPDIRQILIVDYTGIIMVWDIESNRVVAYLEQKGEVNSAKFSPDGKLVVIAGADKTAKVLELATGKLTPLQHQSAIKSAEFSPDGSRILTITSDRRVNVWEVKTEKLIAYVQHDDDINSAKFSLDGKQVVTASDDKTVKVLTVGTGNIFATLHHSSFVKLAVFSPNGKQIVTVSHDKTIKLWDVETELIASVSHQAPVISARFHFLNDSRQMVTASWDGTAKVLDMNTGVITPLKHEGRVNTAEFSPNGRRIVTSSGNTASIWDLETKKVILLVQHDATCWTAEFSRDGEQIVTASRDGTAKVVDVKTGRVITLRHGHNVNTAKFSPDGERVVTTSGEVEAIDESAKVWDVKKIWDEKNWAVKKVWEVEAQEAIASVAHQRGVISARFSPDGKRIATASFDGTAKVLNLETGKIATIHHQALVVSAEFSSDGELVVTASDDNTAIIWNVATEKPIPLRHLNRVRSAKFSPDDKQIVTTSEDGTAKVWDVDTGRPLASIEHPRMVRSAEFSPDAKYISISGWDGTARIWNFAPETRAVSVIEELVGMKVPLRYEGGALVPQEEGFER